MKHLIGHLEGVKITTVAQLEACMDRVSSECRFSVVGRSFHQFEPFGATGVLVLSESHFSAHTYPEHGIVYVDVFCCSPTFDAGACATSIQENFGASSFDFQVITRKSVPTDPGQSHQANRG
jgi:S-adenosylmethionine decarboxylase proenzyme